jgi:DNA-binding PadR family transcriptional regulator
VEQGKLSVQEEIQHSRPNRKVYALTDEGREEFRRWLTEPQALPIFRDPLLMQIFLRRWSQTRRSFSFSNISAQLTARSWKRINKWFFSRWMRQLESQVSVGERCCNA